MMSHVVYFEIPVADLDRAVVFYDAVFGCTLERAVVDGHSMAFFPSGSDASGVSGALVAGDSYVPGQMGARVYFAASDIDAVLARVERAGGRTLYPKTNIGQRGIVAEFEDSEGNCIALHSH
jgi:uncharacterized protein